MSGTNGTAASNSGAYCRARARLTEGVLERLARDVADRCEQEVPDAWRWCGRRVLIGGGSTISLPDTKANRARYPQPPSQKPNRPGPPEANGARLFFSTKGYGLGSARKL